MRSVRKIHRENLKRRVKFRRQAAVAQSVKFAGGLKPRSLVLV
jgi:hypothetical protein